ncbi:MAG: CRTAC1 family protein [Fibrobacteria bacterium]|nr:CRTAC1 family protein [Fibrobacteria bacterium]
MKIMNISNRLVIFAILILCSLNVWPASYSNDSFNKLFKQTSVNFGGHLYTAAAFGDYNNDGFIDLALSYNTPFTNNGFIKIYKNNPSNPGHFSLVATHNGPERQVCWGDYDNDGDLDLFANSGGSVASSYLFRNAGASGGYTLSLVGGTPNGAIGKVANAQGAGWFDANGDGQLDLFQSSGDTYSQIHVNVNGNFWNLAAHYRSDPYNKYSWDRGYYWDRGDAQFLCPQKDYGGYPPPEKVNGSYTVTADIDNNGKQDILYAVDQAGSNNRLFIWLNETQQGSWELKFTEISRLILYPYNAPTSQPLFWSGVSAWDADNDGDLDVLYVNSNGRANGYGYPGPNIYRDQFFENKFGAKPQSFSKEKYNNKLVQNGDVTFGNSTPRQSGGISTGDFDNNGWPDVYITHNGSSDNLYMHKGKNGLSSSTYHTTSSTPNTSGTWAAGASTADVDNDGDLDLFLCNGGILYLNTTNPRNRNAYDDRANISTNSRARNYLNVMVSGANEKSGVRSKDGIGARVYLYEHKDGNRFGKLLAMREIDGGSGYGGQASQIQHFGLDDSWGDKKDGQVFDRHFAVRIQFASPPKDIAPNLKCKDGEKNSICHYDVIPSKHEITIEYSGKKTVHAHTVNIWTEPEVEKDFSYQVIK